VGVRPTREVLIHLYSAGSSPDCTPWSTVCSCRNVQCPLQPSSLGLASNTMPVAGDWARRPGHGACRVHGKCF
jgi:hypothetical protein